MTTKQIIAMMMVGMVACAGQPSAQRQSACAVLSGRLAAATAVDSTMAMLDWQALAALRSAFGHAAAACRSPTARLFAKTSHQQDDDECEEWIDDNDNGVAIGGEDSEDAAWECTTRPEENTALVTDSNKIEEKVFFEGTENDNNFSGEDEEVTNSGTINQIDEFNRQKQTSASKVSFQPNPEPRSEETTITDAVSGEETLTGENTEWYGSVVEKEYIPAVSNPINPSETVNSDYRTVDEGFFAKQETENEESASSNPLITDTQEKIPEVLTFEGNLASPLLTETSNTTSQTPAGNLLEQSEESTTNSKVKEWSALKDEIKNYVYQQIEKELEKRGAN